MTDAVLEARDVVGGYGDLDILKGASARVDAGEVVCILGPNGAGKTTLLRAMFGMIKIRGGQVLLQGRDITGMPPDRVVAQGVAYVPQIQNVFATMTVAENLEMGAYLRDDDLAKTLARVHDLFPVLRERAAEKVGRMSGGQRQMVALGRALMLDPSVLLLDEPSAGLAPKLQGQVFESVRAIAAAGTPVLLVEQNVKRALSVSDRGYVLETGKNRYEGRGADLLSDDRVARLYLGG
jgi:branched-chain amino acid transport system ATP-binding protein